MFSVSSEAKVGLFVLVGLIILGYMSFHVGKQTFGMKKGYTVDVVFDSAAGLDRDASVQIAGVEVVDPKKDSRRARFTSLYHDLRKHKGVDEAEAAFKEELRLFPYNQRAWAGLAMLYRATGRHDESDGAIDTMLRRSPTAGAYGLAERLWTMFGEREKAASARAQARRRVVDKVAAAVILHPDGTLEGGHDPRADGGAAGV